MALKKRKIGPGHAPLGIALLAICALPNEIAALVTACINGPLVLLAAVAGLALIYALEAWWFWKRAQKRTAPPTLSRSAGCEVRV